MPDEPEKFAIALGSAGTVNVEIERSSRAQRLTLRVCAGGRIVVVIPEEFRGNALATAQKFASDNALWLKKALTRERRRPHPAAKTLSAYLREFPKFSALGKTFQIEFGTASLEPFFVFRESSPVAFFCVRDGNADADAETILRQLAAKVLPMRARELAERCGVFVKKISVRAQHSRWGSCTTNGDLSLNWRLLLLPPEIQDHVIFHELAHRRHMNHSGEFWDRLNAWDPLTGTHDRELSAVWAPRIFSILPPNGDVPAGES